MSAKPEFFCRGVAVFVMLAASGVAPAAPLFDADEPLDVVIEVPLNELSRRRREEPELAGTLRYADASGVDRTLAVIVSTRGKTRLEICDFPPLRFSFEPADTSGTLFEGQRELKMVRPCMRGRAGRDWVYLELGAYRTYNVITNNSFRSRQLDVTFRDPDSFFNRETNQPAFFLEDDSDVAKRVNRERIRPLAIDFAQMSASETTHNVLFQYLIGNTDFAVKRGPTGEACCHNGRVIAEPGTQRDWIVVPYDFDYAGIIDTGYAVPHEALPIEEVTSRLYRGFCWQNAVLPESIDLFNRKRAEIEAALMPPEVSPRRTRRVKNYIETFYRIVNDPRELQTNLLDKCREPGVLPVRERETSPREPESQ